MTAHAALKAATAAAHERLDSLFSGLDLSDPDDYRRFLLAHARAFLACEAALAEADDADLPPGWRESRRSDALRSDCEAMGVEVGPLVRAPDYAGAARIGGLYVLEGSRLGGQLLLRQVGERMPHEFLAARAPQGAWRNFISWMEQKLDSHAELDAASRAATETFAAFERAGEGVVGVG